MPENLIQSLNTSDSLLKIIGNYPPRWGRMDQISRLAVIEIGKILGTADLLLVQEHKVPESWLIGLIAGTRRGSLMTDLDFIASHKYDLALASPALFGYTLPNIALAEAASHYGLRGPVYSILSDSHPAQLAQQEADNLLKMQNHLSAVIWGTLDCFSITESNGAKRIQTVVDFNLILQM